MTAAMNHCNNGQTLDEHRSTTDTGSLTIAGNSQPYKRYSGISIENDFVNLL